jgi:hypothetical protein
MLEVSQSKSTPWTVIHPPLKLANHAKCTDKGSSDVTDTHCKQGLHEEQTNHTFGLWVVNQRSTAARVRTPTWAAHTRTIASSNEHFGLRSSLPHALPVGEREPHDYFTSCAYSIRQFPCSDAFRLQLWLATTETNGYN